MFGDRHAVECKLHRSRYVFDQVASEGDRILDYGSGMGFLSSYMAAAGASEVVGVEIVPSFRETSEYVAKEVFEVGNVRFVESDADLQAASFDAVVMCNVVSHIADLAGVLVRVAQVLKPGGRLFIEDNNNKCSVIHRARRMHEWRDSDRGAREKRRELDPGREDLTYGLGQIEVERWRGHDLSQLQRLREFAPYDIVNSVYHENWFTPKELELLLFHARFAPVSHRAKYVFDFKTRRGASSVFRSFPRLSLLVAPAFELVAVKI
jgi:SAM-dependent methyltransferase